LLHSPGQASPVTHLDQPGQAGSDNSRNSGMMEGASDTVRKGRSKASAMGRSIADTTERATESVSDMASSAYRSAGRAAETASAMASAAYDSAGRAAEGIRDAASATGDYATGVGRTARRGTGRLRRYASHLAREQPLVLGALGLAAGALLGVGLPSTRMDHDLMGDASDAVKGRAKETADEQYRRARHAASGFYEGAVDELAGRSDQMREAIRS